MKFSDHGNIKLSSSQNRTAPIHNTERILVSRDELIPTKLKSTVSSLSQCAGRSMPLEGKFSFFLQVQNIQLIQSIFVISGKGKVYAFIV